MFFSLTALIAMVKIKGIILIPLIKNYSVTKIESTVANTGSFSTGIGLPD